MVNESDESLSSNLKGLTITQIAAWQFPQLRQDHGIATVSLPALQRSAVWRARQIEYFWDSLCRGFPVGSFLMAPFDNVRGARSLKFAAAPALPSEPNSAVSFHLLDGQQRSNAIALAFMNPWRPRRDTEESLPDAAALWVDLARPKNPTREERKYVFRVVTQSHPWGYRRTDPADRLEARNRREALLSYRRYLDRAEADLFQPGHADLRFAWPWDCELPVPVPMLAELLRAGDTDLVGALSAIRRRATDLLPFWGDVRFNALRKSIEAPGDEFLGHVASLLEGLSYLLGLRPEKGTYRIPALVLPEPIVEGGKSVRASVRGSTTQIDNSVVDPVETLFVRINAGGTVLDGDELSYSLLKSIWPGAEELVEQISSSITSPARLVMLFTRLVLANSVDKDDPPRSPDVREFRRLVHGVHSKHPYFLSDLKKYLISGRAPKLLHQATACLQHDRGTHVAVGLPSVLVTDIARKSPDSFFLLMRWLDKCDFSSIDLGEISLQYKRRIIGAITALSWYSIDSRLWLKALWTEIEAVSGAELKNFWDTKGRLLCAVRPVDNVFPMIPPLPADKFRAGGERRLRGLLKGARTVTWKRWNWEDDFVGKPPANDEITPFLNKVLKAFGPEYNDSAITAKNLWSEFADRTWELRQLVLYSQKEQLKNWFPNFDAARHDQLEDTDRPWDMDHIHAQNYIKNIRQPTKHFAVIREWHGSIGNLRAWPLELNRSDGDTSPRVKLRFDPNSPDAAQYQRYNMSSSQNICSSSFISQSWQQPWDRVTPEAPFPVNYLKEEGDHYPALLRAIFYRWITLYEHWYKDFEVKHHFQR